MAALEKLEAEQAKIAEEEDAAERAFKRLPYKARNGAVKKIGDKFWDSSSWRARLAAAEEAAEEITTEKTSTNEQGAPQGWFVMGWHPPCVSAMAIGPSHWARLLGPALGPVRALATGTGHW